jgi:hypothetical protein
VFRCASFGTLSVKQKVKLLLDAYTAPAPIASKSFDKKMALMLYRDHLCFTGTTYALQALMLYKFATSISPIATAMAAQACAQAQHLPLRAVVLAVGFDLSAALESHGVIAICCS